MFHLPEEIQEYIFQMSTKLRFREKFMSDILENSSRISTLCESKKKYGVVICQIKEECCYIQGINFMYDVSEKYLIFLKSNMDNLDINTTFDFFYYFVVVSMGTGTLPWEDYLVENTWLDSFFENTLDEFQHWEEYEFGIRKIV
jgi:hypothetical protein|tara:strand:+ start:244 stop:675 length:432 start_codon:yes stop_codon:yes gene_type:complete